VPLKLVRPLVQRFEVRPTGWGRQLDEANSTTGATEVPPPCASPAGARAPTSAMALGFATAYPVNVRLVRHRIEEAM
jgi:hypothetical protein